MKKALVLMDETSRFSAPPGTVAKILADVYDGMFSVSVQTDYRGLNAEDLKPYHMVILAMEEFDAGADVQTVAALIRYTVNGGALLFLADALRCANQDGMHLLAASDVIRQGPPVLLDIAPAGDHVIVRDAQPVHFVEYPTFFELDPLYDPQVLLTFSYAGKDYPIAWCHTYGWGKAACFGFGMIAESYLRPVRRLFWRTGEWFLDRL